MTVCESGRGTEKPLFGMLVPDSMLRKNDDESFRISPEQVAYLGITETQLEELDPLVFCYRNKEDKFEAFKQAPVVLWEGKAVNVGKAPRIIV